MLFSTILLCVSFISHSALGSCTIKENDEFSPLLVSGRILFSNGKNEYNLVLRLYNNTDKILKFYYSVLSERHYSTKFFDESGHKVPLKGLFYGGHTPYNILEVEPDKYIERSLSLSMRYPGLASELKKGRLLLKWDTPISTQSIMEDCTGGIYKAHGEIMLVFGEQSEKEHYAEVKCAPFTWE